MRNLTSEKLRALLSYDAETGVFTRLTAVGGNAVGSVPGALDWDGYIRIGVCGKRYPAHRLAWLYVHGQFPQKDLDHMNGVRSDNRMSNLREVAPGENGQNQRAPKSNNKSGYLGVYFNKKAKKWEAAIKTGGVKKFLGTFSDPKEASSAYLAAKKEFHPFQMIV